MRHRVYGKHLGRNKDQRKNLFQGLVYSLFSYGTIQTSEVKAKAIKGLVDKIINSAKSKNISQLQSFVSDKSLRERLSGEIIPKLDKRTSGYTRVVRMGTRLGDQTTMVRMSLIGAEQLKPLESRVVNEEPTKGVSGKEKNKKEVQKKLKVKGQKAKVQSKSEK